MEEFTPTFLGMEYTSLVRVKNNEDEKTYTSDALRVTSFRVGNQRFEMMIVLQPSNNGSEDLGRLSVHKDTHGYHTPFMIYVPQVSGFNIVDSAMQEHKGLDLTIKKETVNCVFHLHLVYQLRP